MPLKGLKTKVASQPKLPSAPQGKFPIGGNPGTQKKSNGIVSGGNVKPKITANGTKKSDIFVGNDAKDKNEQQKVIATQTNASQSSINKKFAVYDDMPEPLAVFSFRADDIINILAAARQSLFEDRCSLEFSKKMIAKLQEANSSVLKAAEKAANDEIIAAKDTLDNIEAIMQLVKTFDSTLSNPPTEQIRASAAITLAKLNPEKFATANMPKLDPVSIVSHMSATTAKMRAMTSVVAQVLSLAANCLSRGYTPVIANKNPAYSGELGTSTTFVEAVFKNTTGMKNAVDNNNFGLASTALLFQQDPSLLTLSLAKTPNASFLSSKVFDLVENKSYITHLNLKDIAGVNNLRMSAILLTMLANEYALSAGLGRLDGTPLGQSFHSTNKHIQNFLGVSEMHDVTTETTARDSLVDYLLVDAVTGTPIVKNESALLLDGKKFLSSDSKKNAVSAFVEGILTQPLSSDTNRTQILAAALINASKKYDSGIAYYEVLHNRDKKLELLTPRGLFTRLLDDFADVLFMVQPGAQDAAMTAMQELSMIRLLSKYEKYSTDEKSLGNIVKQAIVTYMAKRAISVQNSSLQNATTTTKVTTKDANGNSQTFESTVEQSTPEGSSFDPPDDVVRLCSNDRVFYDSVLYADESVFDSVAELGYTSANISIDNNFVTIDVDKKQALERILTGKSVVFEMLVKIYTEMCEEAKKLCESNQPYVTVLRLTKHSQIDGTLSLAMLFETVCALCDEFVNVQEATWVSFDQKQRLIAHIDVGANNKTSLARKALKAIVAASKSNDASILTVLDKNGNELVPELGNLPTTTTLSNTGSNISFAMLRDILGELAFERDIAAACLSAAHAIIKQANIAAEPVIDIGKQLLDQNSNSSSVKNYIDFAKSSIGKKYLASYNEFGLATSRKTLEHYVTASKSSSLRSEKISQNELKCISILLHDIVKSRTTVEIATVMLPQGYISQILSKNFGTKREVFELSLHQKNMFGPAQTSVMKVHPWAPQAQLATQSSVLKKEYSVECFIHDSAFRDAKLSNVNSMTDIAQSIRKILTNENFRSASDKRAAIILQNEISSYLLSKCFSVLSAADLFTENIVDRTFSEIPFNKQLASEFAAAYGLSTSTFDEVFKDGGDIDREKLVSLTKTKYKTGSSSIILSEAPITFGEAELFFDLFSTLVFQVGSIRAKIFSPSLADRIVTLAFSREDFLKPAMQQKKTKDTYSTDIAAFDIYSTEVTAAKPLSK